ncbi:hypothetical protein VOLCADRAFT_103473 [Volvox carteri f. nagariensis]|uniref:Uncharacterized protein n=1 Tax=Volvox carteri f. nagariensis TaxID=3068 RepID=D8TM37_VOLCA|nr:uncharacterized protein VOLCADRAFT_103473 [Volvox carteri f. nagariensis]EFJ51573.1 hypothetical protein VOLCADRAFT_103473 [Volvox carteri f. nagariensis]|eukprot:XP_002947525.1 hypothetical protein VOLCADRAFT_103473 [Volvox carteri f. nagariensis]
MQLQARPPSALRVGATRVARRPRVVRVQAASSRAEVATADESTVGPSRRSLFTMTAGALLAGVASSSHPAQALTCASETTTEADDTACRRAVLSNDQGAVQNAEANYGSLSEKKFTAVSGVPVAVLDSEYVRSTLKLREDIISYATLDVNNYQVRVPLIKTLRTEGSDWVSKYARGGSARTDSARRMYIAVDALIGHLASNGYAPMPKPKLKVVLANVDQAKAFLEEGK